jgi:hypothetical protein
MLAAYALFLIMALPLTGFVALSIKLQRDALEREQQAHQQSWKKAHNYKSLYTFPPKRLF